MSDRMTAERLAEMELRAETLELDTRTWSDRDELLQALKAERERFKDQRRTILAQQAKLDALAVFGTAYIWLHLDTNKVFVKVPRDVYLAALEEKEDDMCAM